MCDPLPATMVKIPAITKPNLNTFGKVTIPNFDYEQR